MQKPTIRQTNVTEAMNVNPYDVFNKQGMLKLTPSEDNWIEESRMTITQQEASTIDVKRWWKHQGDSWVEDQIAAVQNITLDAGQNWTDNMGGKSANAAYTGSTLHSGGQQTIENMIEFMRQIDIQFEASNLHPNSNNLIMTFDGVRVPVTPASGFNKGSETGSVMSNSQGIAKGSFKIPAGIRTGTREVMLRNEDNTAVTSFIAQGTHKTTQDIIIRTRVTVNLIDPLAQSFQFDTNKVISSVGVYFGSKSATNNIVIQVRNITEGGMPGKTVFGETVLTPSQVNISSDGSAETRIHFADPIMCDAGKEYCVVAITDNADYTMWIGTRGQTDLKTKNVITSNPYLVGVLYSSSNASAWTIHQESDLKFNIYTAKFNDQAIMEFDSISNVNADSIVLMATYLTPENTACAWDIKMVMVDEPLSTAIDSKPWLPIANYVDLDLNQVARHVKLRATFESNRNISPLMSVQDLTFASFTSALQGSYVGRTVDMSEAPYNTLRVSYEAFTPQGATVSVQYSTDGGSSWRSFSTQPSVSQQSNEFTKYTYEEKVASGTATYSSFKVRINLLTQNSFLRPRVRRLLTNMRNE